MPSETHDLASAASSDTESSPPRRPRSIRSWRSRSSFGRSRSRPASPDTHLHRIYSSGIPDAIPAFGAASDDRGRNAALVSDRTPGGQPSPTDERDESEALEEVESPEDDSYVPKTVRITGDGDLEKAPTHSGLDRQQTNKSTRSVNMVSWASDDPDNPKNCMSY